MTTFTKYHRESLMYCFGFIKQLQISEATRCPQILPISIDKMSLLLISQASKQHRLKRYHSQTYVNGSKCDLNGNPRETEVRVRHLIAGCISIPRCLCGLFFLFNFSFLYSVQRYEVSGNVHDVLNDPPKHTQANLLFIISSLCVKKAQVTISPEWMSLSRAATCWQFTPVVPASIHSCGPRPPPSPRVLCASQR